jgi:adenine phosphoribosyltransferase
VAGFAEEFTSRFQWIDGHADVLSPLADGAFLGRAVAALAEPFRDAGVTKVAAVEARGFIVGAGVALRLGVGFVPMRKEGAIFPGVKASHLADPDWRGRRHVLQVQRDALDANDRVLLVDDWAELGSQALAARWLVEECDATWAGLSLLVDQLRDDVRAQLEPVHAVVRHDELPPSK